MKNIAKLAKGIMIVAMTTLIGGAPVPAGTFVYVSNADDGDIGVYSVQTDGSETWRARQGGECCHADGG